MLTPTKLEDVEAHIRSAINGIVPRMQSGRELMGWTPYERASASAAKTRRYRLEWALGSWTEGGIFGLGASDTTCQLHIIVDYTIPEQRMAEVVEDDWWQVRDVLAALALDGSRGIIQIDSQTPPSIYEEENKDHFQADMTYTVRYLKARA